MSDFVTTYRGVPVPDGIVFISVGDSAEAAAFKAGVDGVLDSAPAPYRLATDALTEMATLPQRFIGRVFLDDSGDEWHEQSPNSFDCSWNGWDRSDGYLANQSEEDLRKRYPHLALVNKPATRRPH